MTVPTPAQHWRQGGKVPHHVYAQRGDEPDRRPYPDGDPPLAMFLNPDDAALAVRAVNWLLDHIDHEHQQPLTEPPEYPVPMADCVFCGIAAGTEPAQIIRQWPDAIAFVPLNPVTTGHALVVPRTHVRDAVENQPITALTMARAAELASGYTASNILTSVGAAATQSIFHLHIHVVPRSTGDQLMLPWGTTGNPHDPHWCKVAEALAAELAELRDVVKRS